MKCFAKIIPMLILRLAWATVVFSTHPTQPPDNAKTNPKAMPVSPKFYNGDGWAIAAPDNWNRLATSRPPVVLYLSGDGQQGFPSFDGTLAVMMAGLQVEVFPKGELSLKEHVARDVNELKESGAFKLMEDPKLKEISLMDGTAATVLDAEFIRLRNGRVSMQCKVYCADVEGRHVVASSFVTCSRPGRQSVNGLGITDLLRTSATSLVLDPEKLDTSVLLPAYEKHDWNVGTALDLVSNGNDLLEMEKFVEAAATYRKAIKRWDSFSAAHNGLAWSLLHAKDSKQIDLDEALHEAQIAVKQTEELDVSSLDTLSLAYERNNDRKNAIKTVKQALVLEPGNSELQARLKSLE